MPFALGSVATTADPAVMACDHSAPHSGVAQYMRDDAKLRPALVCDRCGDEIVELETVDYQPHARRYKARLAELTARELGLDDEVVARVRLATLICDVGRDGIPPEILNKRGPLTAREWVEIRRPSGMRGDQIPLEARILSVVDAYVAMTSDRPQRPAKHSSSALRELLDNAGSQFDTAVVTAFIRARIHDPRALDLIVA